MVYLILVHSFSWEPQPRGCFTPPETQSGTLTDCFPWTSSGDFCRIFVSPLYDAVTYCFLSFMGYPQVSLLDVMSVDLMKSNYLSALSLYHQLNFSFLLLLAVYLINSHVHIRNKSMAIIEHSQNHTDSVLDSWDCVSIGSIIGCVFLAELHIV